MRRIQALTGFMSIEVEATLENCRAIFRKPSARGDNEESGRSMDALANSSTNLQNEADYLRLVGVTKTYSGIAVVDGVSMAVRKGEILTILGPSGCGKTTTLKIVAGFIEPDQRLGADGGQARRPVVEP